jgi:hypothetical protein
LISNSLTICAELSELSYDTIDSRDGFAKVIRFRLMGDHPRFGDTLLVVAGSDILFHGLVRAIEPDGSALALDPGSKLPRDPS